MPDASGGGLHVKMFSKVTDDPVERQIQQLQRDGELSDLEGQGRPLADLEEPYDPM